MKSSGNFSQLVISSVLARFLAIIILSIVMLCALVVATVDLLRGQMIPSAVTTIIGAGLGIAGTLVGINFGVTLQPTPIIKNEEDSEK